MIGPDDKEEEKEDKEKDGDKMTDLIRDADEADPNGWWNN